MAAHTPVYKAALESIKSPVYTIFISLVGKRAGRAPSPHRSDMEITRSPAYAAKPLKGDISVLPLDKSSHSAEARINTILGRAAVQLAAKIDVVVNRRAGGLLHVGWL